MEIFSFSIKEFSSAVLYQGYQQIFAAETRKKIRLTPMWLEVILFLILNSSNSKHCLVIFYIQQGEGCRNTV